MAKALIAVNEMSVLPEMMTIMQPSERMPMITVLLSRLKMLPIEKKTGLIVPITMTIAMKASVTMNSWVFSTFFTKYPPPTQSRPLRISTRPWSVNCSPSTSRTMRPLCMTSTRLQFCTNSGMSSEITMSAKPLPASSLSLS